VAVILFVLTVLILSWLMHFNFWDFFKPKEKPADMVFTIVNDTHAAKPDKPLFKGNFNQRAGGKQDQKQPLKPVEEPPQSSAAKKANAPSKSAPTQQPVEPQQTAAAQPPAPQPPAPKPKAEQKKAPAPQPSLKPAVALPKPPEPKTEGIDGPVAPTQMATASSSSNQSNPVPAQIGSLGEAFSGAGTASTAAPNPQDGPGSQPGVDVAADADYGPFMAELQKRIKRNWTPPRGAESRRVRLLFYLARDGRVVKIDVADSSGNEDTDRAAIDAVQASAPFRGIPVQAKADILPIEFTFDYNVLKPKSAKRG
jgi:TonB family protein